MDRCHNAPPARRARYAQKRDQAIAAAARVFADKGYHGATTRDIADLLGIRQGSLYYYFKSKEEALEEVCVLALRDYVGRMEAIAGGAEPFPAKLHAVIPGPLSSYRDATEALKVHNDLRLYLPEERRERIKRDGSRYRQLLEELFAREVAKGNLPQDTHCGFVTQSVIGLCNAWGDIIVRDDTVDIDELSRRCLGLVLQGVTHSPYPGNGFTAP